MVMGSKWHIQPTINKGKFRAILQFSFKYEKLDTPSIEFECSREGLRLSDNEHELNNNSVI